MRCFPVYCMFFLCQHKFKSVSLRRFIYSDALFWKKSVSVERNALACNLLCCTYSSSGYQCMYFLLQYFIWKSLVSFGRMGMFENIAWNILNILKKTHDRHQYFWKYLDFTTCQEKLVTQTGMTLWLRFLPYSFLHCLLRGVLHLLHICIIMYICIIGYHCICMHYQICLPLSVPPTTWQSACRRAFHNDHIVIIEGTQVVQILGICFVIDWVGSHWHRPVTSDKINTQFALTVDHLSGQIAGPWTIKQTFFTFILFHFGRIQICR